ncbi:MAG TPA: acyl carrier protein [Tepidisphaeraceae bacterium]|jgi:acyl carrier protein|nr:acyl carrier protein [Tepidisphaeraceae bacterium]
MSDRKTTADSHVRERIEDILVSRMHLRLPEPHTDLFAAGLLDSLTFIDLLLHLEREFGTKFALDDLELDHFRSISRIERLIGSNGAMKEADGPAAAVLAR